MARKVTSQRRLIESERSFRLLVDGVIDYAIYMLDLDGVITSWNAGARRIKGYEASEVVGRHFGMFYLPEDREAGKPTRALETAREQGRFAAEGWRVCKDGTKFFASVVIDAIHEDGELIGFAKITRDITEQTRAQAALNASEGRRRNSEDHFARKKPRCFSLMGISSFSITFIMSSQTFRFSLGA